MHGRVLIVAGSDSGGGAGIQADIKTITALNGFAMTAITALTAQNTIGVQDIYPVPAAFVARQMASVFDDLGIDAVKTGMLPSADIITAVCDVLDDRTVAACVVDPVMVASSGASLIKGDAVAAMKERLFPKATVLTPNIPEAEILTGARITDVEDMVETARQLRHDGAAAVLVKGGHLSGGRLTDVLATENGIRLFEGERIESRATHGTGCSLASAIATGLAQGQPLEAAVERARRFVRLAIIHAIELGSGSSGPMNHAVTVTSAGECRAEPLKR